MYMAVSNDTYNPPPFFTFCPSYLSFFLKKNCRFKKKLYICTQVMQNIYNLKNEYIPSKFYLL
jgi:hypothetical protein